MQITSISQNVDRVDLNGKTIYLVGTAHVSPASVALAEETIRSINPDSVAIELCEPRFNALRDPNRWKNTDILEVIKSGKAFLLLAQLMLGAFQRKLGKELEVKPGAEMLRSAQVAEELGKTIVLADRDVKVTLKRTWSNLTFWQKLKLVVGSPLTMISADKIDLEEIERLKQSDALEEAMKELAERFPGVRSALIDERDKYLAMKIANAPGNTIVAIVGAGHIPGMKRYIDQQIDLTPLEVIPPPGIIGKIISWSIPLAVIGLIIYAALTSGLTASVEMAEAWILITGISAAIGAALALSHPLTILTAFVTAPFTTLHPLLASGWFAGIVEAILKKPKVADLENVLDDFSSLKGIWSNRLSRILLVVAFTNLTGTIGSFIAMGKLAWFAGALK